jgi:hypothetical protein
MAFKRVIIRRVGPLFWLLEPMRVFLTIALLILFSGCSSRQESNAGVTVVPPKSLSDTDAIYSAIILTISTSSTPADMSNQKGFVLCVLGEDPSPALLESLKVSKITVYPCSASALVRSTNKPVIEFYIHEVISQSKNEVTVSANYYNANESTTDYTFVVVKKSGEWVVVHTQDQVRLS